ncbi:MAG: transporter [Bacteroidaceae bacterium]|nr:transporter [Bacteroidaceae bacterium]
MNIRKFLRNWALPLSMIAGASGYLFCRSLPLSPTVKEAVVEGVSYVQPILIFCMLTLTFCRIRPSDMRLRGWQWWLLALQAGLAVVLCILHQSAEDSTGRLFLQSTMLCFLCPTATAAAVVTTKLGGNAGTLTAYTMLINLCAAVLFPVLIPIVNPTGNIGFWLSFWMIIRRVFPLLIFPLLVAFVLRRISPALVRSLVSRPDLPFHLWVVSLSLAIAVTTRIVVHAEVTPALCLAIAAGSVLACVVQFAVGKKIGGHYTDAISAGQACGQKNTVLAIWMGYTFFDPLTALAGGFYSIWHNVYNAWQLYRRRPD